MYNKFIQLTTQVLKPFIQCNPDLWRDCTKQVVNLLYIAVLSQPYTVDLNIKKNLGKFIRTGNSPEARFSIVQVEQQQYVTCGKYK